MNLPRHASRLLDLAEAIQRHAATGEPLTAVDMKAIADTLFEEARLLRDREGEARRRRAQLRIAA